MRARVIVLAAVALAAAVLFLAPYLEPYGTFIGLDGRIGIMDHPWDGVNVISQIAYGIGDIVCHQNMLNSLTLNGSQMPFCARDVGIVLGILIGGIVISAIPESRMRSRWVLIIAAAFMAIMFMDWGVQHFTELHSNITRTATGMLAGAAVSMIIGRLALNMKDGVLMR